MVPTFDITQIFPLEDIAETADGPTRFLCDRTALEFPTKRVATALKLSDGDKVVVSYKRFVAGTTNLAYLVNYIPECLFNEEQLGEVFVDPATLDPFWSYLYDELGCTVSHHEATVDVATAAELKYPISPPAQHAAFMRMIETGYDTDDVPRWCSYVWLAQHTLQLSVTRNYPAPAHTSCVAC